MPHLPELRPPKQAAGPKSPVPRPAAGPKTPAPGKAKAPVKVPPEVQQASKSAHLGGYVKIQRVGVGSMGEVYKAWDLKEGRWVALKILRSQDPTQLARFIREAQVASQMQHPNITPIYDAGKDKGLWYLAMKYLSGHTLKKFPRGNRRISVQLMRDAARALEYAHSRGIIHRDLKPDNFMVRSKPKPGKEASKAIDDFVHHIWVMDFGIARPSESTSQLTMPGTVMGSPSFMSPEQALGKIVDARADVYSLGATLYQRLTGVPPFESKSIFEALRRVQEEMPKPPSQLEKGIDAGLDAIVMKCLEKDPAKRYQTAGELAEALDGWLTPAVVATGDAVPKKKGCGGAAVLLIAAAAAAAAFA